MLWIYVLAAVSAFAASLVLTPTSIFLAKKFGAIDALDPRKVHLFPKPRWGGIGIVGGFIAGLVVLWFFSPPFAKLLTYSYPVKHAGKILFTLNLGEQLAGILFGVVVLFIMGLLDDRKPIPAGMKLSVQIIAAFVAMIYGVRVYGLSIPGFESYRLFPLWIMQIITILWLVGMTNAINLIDGLDGLASGIVVIVAGSFVCVALLQERAFSSVYTSQIKLAGVISACLLGGVLGFLIYNFYPSQLFMGDSGSLSMGYLVGCIAIIGAFKTTMLAVLLIPFLLVAVPVLDMTVALGRRLLKRQNPFLPDRSHFHHKLLDAGWTQREIVFLIYTLTLLLSVFSLMLVALRKPS